VRTVGLLLRADKESTAVCDLSRQPAIFPECKHLGAKVAGQNSKMSTFSFGVEKNINLC